MPYTIKSGNIVKKYKGFSNQRRPGASLASAVFDGEEDLWYIDQDHEDKLEDVKAEIVRLYMDDYSRAPERLTLYREVQ